MNTGVNKLYHAKLCHFVKFINTKIKIDKILRNTLNIVAGSSESIKGRGPLLKFVDLNQRSTRLGVDLTLVRIFMKYTCYYLTFRLL